MTPYGSFKIVPHVGDHRGESVSLSCPLLQMNFLLVRINAGLGVITGLSLCGPVGM